MIQWMTLPKLFSGARTSQPLASTHLGFWVSALVSARSQDQSQDLPSIGCCVGLHETPRGTSDVLQDCRPLMHTSGDIDEPTSNNSDGQRPRILAGKLRQHWHASPKTPFDQLKQVPMLYLACADSLSMVWWFLRSLSVHPFSQLKSCELCLFNLIPTMNLNHTRQYMYNRSSSSTWSWKPGSSSMILATIWRMRHWSTSRWPRNAHCTAFPLIMCTTAFSPCTVSMISLSPVPSNKVPMATTTFMKVWKVSINSITSLIGLSSVTAFTISDTFQNSGWSIVMIVGMLCFDDRLHR